jgi:hypothetical protein
MAEPDTIFVWAIRNRRTGAKCLEVLEKDKPKYRVPLPADANAIEAINAFGERLATERGETVTLALMNDLSQDVSVDHIKQMFKIPPGRGH